MPSALPNHAPLECRWLRWPDETEPLREAWQALSARTPATHVFTTYRWLDAWCEAFALPGEVSVAAIYDRSELVGVMPVAKNAVWRGPGLSVRFDYRPQDSGFLVDRPRYRFFPMTQLSPPINLESGNLRGDLLAAPGREAECERALFASLRALPGWHVGVLTCPAEKLGAWLEAARAAGLPAYARASQRSFHGLQRLIPWPDYVQTRSRKFRQNMRYTEARAQAFEGGLRLKVFVDASDMQEGLNHFFALAKRSWKATGRDGALDFEPVLTGGTRRFYEKLCLMPSPEFKPYLQLHYAGDRAVAGILCLVCQARLFACLTYYDPDITHVSPGRLLFKDLFSWGAENGVGSIDFNGASSFVRYFADHAVGDHQLLVFRPHPYARLLHAMSRRLSPGVISAPGSQGELA